MGTRAAKELLAAACLALLLAAGGCGDAEHASDRQASKELDVTGVGQARVGSIAQLAQCHDWTDGTRAERIATIHDIRATLNQAGGLEPTSDLGDKRAYALLQRACSNEFASGFRLYKLYARGAAFGRLAFAPGRG